MAVDRLLKEFVRTTASGSSLYSIIVQHCSTYSTELRIYPNGQWLAPQATTGERLPRTSDDQHGRYAADTTSTSRISIVVLLQATPLTRQANCRSTTAVMRSCCHVSLLQRAQRQQSAQKLLLVGQDPRSGTCYRSAGVEEIMQILTDGASTSTLQGI